MNSHTAVNNEAESEPVNRYFPPAYAAIHLALNLLCHQLCYRIGSNDTSFDAQNFCEQCFPWKCIMKGYSRLPHGLLENFCCFDGSQERSIECINALDKMCPIYKANRRYTCKCASFQITDRGGVGGIMYRKALVTSADLRRAVCEIHYVVKSVRDCNRKLGFRGEEYAYTLSPWELYNACVLWRARSPALEQHDIEHARTDYCPKPYRYYPRKATTVFHFVRQMNRFSPDNEYMRRHEYVFPKRRTKETAERPNKPIETNQEAIQSAAPSNPEWGRRCFNEVDENEWMEPKPWRHNTEDYVSRPEDYVSAALSKPIPQPRRFSKANEKDSVKARPRRHITDGHTPLLEHHDENNPREDIPKPTSFSRPIPQPRRFTKANEKDLVKDKPWRHITDGHTPLLEHHDENNPREDIPKPTSFSRPIPQPRRFTKANEKDWVKAKPWRHITDGYVSRPEHQDERISKKDNPVSSTKRKTFSDDDAVTPKEKIRRVQPGKPSQAFQYARRAYDKWRGFITSRLPWVSRNRRSDPEAAYLLLPSSGSSINEDHQDIEGEVEKSHWSD
ncbi:hypothetical protein E8E14_013440 [Neopestalotiopsis sp. 37M]|nr:hypothetical protein E8E14_013440 [Neopestalotiopsis sp. 37M]